MPRFFVTDEGAVTEKTVVISGNDAHHISRSLRMKIGEELTVCDGRGCDFLCRVSRISDKEVELEILSRAPVTSEAPYRAVVYQSLVRGEKFDTVIQKAVEFGAAEIVPVLASRCNVKLDAKDAPKKLERWNRIAEEAAKQCGRGIIPTVSSPMKLADALKEAGKAALPMFCYEKETCHLKEAVENCPDAPSASILIGPEGGFSEEEAAAAREAGLVSVSLGPRILRTESAAQFALACLSYAFEG